MDSNTMLHNSTHLKVDSLCEMSSVYIKESDQHHYK